MGAFAKVEKGQEYYDVYLTKIRGKRVKRFQYDYRDMSGDLFSCIAKTLDEARQRRDEWIKRDLT